MARRNFWEYTCDFFGHDSFTATAGDNAPFLIKDTSAAGTPTYALVDGSPTGELALTFSSDTEAQILTLYQNNIEQYDIDLIREVEWRVKVSSATLDTANILVCGVASGQNDTADSVAEHAWFRLSADNNLTVETDDGTTDNDDKATGKTLGTTYKNLLISFANGKSDIRFFVDNEPVATSTTFSMAAYSSSLQLFLQWQKSSDNNTQAVTIDRVSIRGIR